jgi:hypothetical protein
VVGPVSAYPESSSQITDPEAARAADMAFRSLRVKIAVGGTQWLFVAGVLALVTSLSRTLDVVVAIAGAGYAVGLAGYFGRRHRSALSEFADPVTGEIAVPGARLPIPHRERVRSVLIVGTELAVLLLLLARY